MEKKPDTAEGFSTDLNDTVPEIGQGEHRLPLANKAGLEEDPWDGVRLRPDDSHSRRELTMDELRRLLAAAKMVGGDLRAPRNHDQTKNAFCDGCGGLGTARPTNGPVLPMIAETYGRARWQVSHELARIFRHANIATSVRLEGRHPHAVEWYNTLNERMRDNPCCSLAGP